jgi:CheY-like chemotaxis protein
MLVVSAKVDAQMPTHTCVLVTDDDSDTRETVRMLLEDADYVVLEAEDGAAALDILRTSPDSLVVLFDYLMPGTDGAAFLAQAEQEHMLAGPHTFICMTASPRLVPPALAAALTRYDVPLVSKPFGIDALLAVIQQAAQHLGLLAAAAPAPATVPQHKQHEPPELDRE